MRRGWLLLLTLLLAVNCTKRVRLDIPPAHLQAQIATMDELTDLINHRYSTIDTLTLVGARIEFVSKFMDQGFAKQYPGGKAQLVARAPDAIYLNILNPLTSTTVVTMASEQDRFQIWIPRENKYLVGNNDVRVENPDPMYHVRPAHVLEAVLIEPLPSQGDSQIYFMEEAEDPIRKYYVIAVLQPDPDRGKACLQRKIWVERSALQIDHQVYYACGRPISRISYGSGIEIGRKIVSTQVELDRIDENYLLRLGVDEGQIRIDREVRSDTFQVPQPPGAERIEVLGDAGRVPGLTGSTGGNR